MPTPQRIAKRAAKKINQQLYNFGRKIIRAQERLQETIALGQTVIVAENADGTKTYSFPPKIQEPQTPPRLSWLGGKTFRHGNPRKNLSGCAPEHAEANIENASRAFATEVTKALAPDTPAVDGAPIETTAPEFLKFPDVAVGQPLPEASAA